MSHRFCFAVFAVAALTSVACSSGSTSQTPSDAGSSSKTPSTPGTTDSGGPEDKTGGGGDVGPSCTAYLECCDTLAGGSAAGCDTVRKTIKDNIDNGISVETYETSCKTALDTLKSAGSCK